MAFWTCSLVVLELIIFILFLQAEGANVVKVDLFFFAVMRLRTNRAKRLVWDFALIIFFCFSFSHMTIVVIAVVLIHVIFCVFLVTSQCFKIANVMPMLVLLLKSLSPLACSTQTVLMFVPTCIAGHYLTLFSILYLV